MSSAIFSPRPVTSASANGTISVTLLPAGNTNELGAFDSFLAAVSRQNLVLPGDPMRRRIRFRSQTS